MSIITTVMIEIQCHQTRAPTFVFWGCIILKILFYSFYLIFEDKEEKTLKGQTSVLAAQLYMFSFNLFTSSLIHAALLIAHVHSLWTAAHETSW